MRTGPKLFRTKPTRSSAGCTRPRNIRATLKSMNNLAIDYYVRVQVRRGRSSLRAGAPGSSAACWASEHLDTPDVDGQPWPAPISCAASTRRPMPCSPKR